MSEAEAYPFREACDPRGGPNKLPCGVDHAYAELKRGRIRTFLVGNRRWITKDAIREYLELLEREAAEGTSREAS